MKNAKRFFFIILAIVVLVSICMFSRGYGITIGTYFETNDNVAILISKNTPILMSSNHNGDMFNEFSQGDTMLVVHDGIAESYPAKTIAYFVSKVKDGSVDDVSQNVLDELTKLGWTPGNFVSAEEYDVTVAYANWSETACIGGLNTHKQIYSNILHLPIYKLDTMNDLLQFKMADDKFTFDSGYDEVPSFNDVTSNYDETFFENHSLIVVYVPANSGSFRYDVKSIYYDGSAFCVHVEQTNHPEIYTNDMAGWFITIAVSDDMIENCIEFDADLQ